MQNKETHTSVFKGMAGFLQVAMVTVVFLVLTYFLQAMGVHVTQMFRQPRVRANRTYSVDPAERSFQFLLDGAVHQIHNIGQLDPNGDSIEEVYDVNDAPIVRGPRKERKAWAYLSFPLGMNGYSKRNLRSIYGLSPGFSSAMDVPVFKGKDLEEIWRYDRRRQFFAGYDRSGESLGFIGKDGVTVDASEALGLGELQAFEIRWAPSKDRPLLLWWTQDNLYEIDVKLRQVERFIDQDEAEISQVVTQTYGQRGDYYEAFGRDSIDPNLYRPLVVCQAGDLCCLALYESDQRITVTLPEAWSQFNSRCQFVATKADLFMKRWWTDFRPLALDASAAERQQWIQEYRSTKKRHWTELYRVHDNGDLEQVHALNWMETKVFELPEPRRLAWTGERVLRCLSPGLYSWSFFLAAKYNPSALDHNSFIVFFHESFPQDTWDYCFSSLVLLFVCFWHGRKRWTSAIQGLPWLCLIMAFNLAGYLTYLALNHTPLIRCASCGKERGLQRDACSHCHALLPEPEHSRPHLVMA